MSIRISEYFASPVLVALALVVLTGCKKEAPLPSVQTDRRADAAYQQQLGKMASDQRKIASRRARIAAEMEKLVAKARAALGEDASDEAIRKELESNPAKYPGWKEYSEGMVKANAELEQEQARARASVAKRISEESVARKAVEQGKAKAVPSPAAK